LKTPLWALINYIKTEETLNNINNSKKNIVESSIPKVCTVADLFSRRIHILSLKSRSLDPKSLDEKPPNTEIICLNNYPFLNREAATR